jgi:hypothetical protein
MTPAAAAHRLAAMTGLETPMIWEPINLSVLVPMAGMLAVFALNHALAQRRAAQQTERDCRGLRAALLAELILLRSLIAENLALMQREEEYLLSCKVLTQIYRSNVGRLHLLPEIMIDAIVSAYGTAEAAEVFVGAAAKPHGSQAYRVWLGDAAWREIGPRLAAAHEAIDVAIDQLERSGRRPLLYQMFGDGAAAGSHPIARRKNAIPSAEKAATSALSLP